MESVRLEWPTEGYARIVFARPEKHNAWRHKELLGIADATEEILDRGARVVSIVAEGPSYSVGGDIDAFVNAMEKERIGHWARQGGAGVNSAIARLKGLDAVVVVGVQGNVAGGGVGYMSVGDFVIAADDLKINLAYVRIGASPDAGTTWFLPRLVNPLRAFEMLALGETFDAQGALDWGLVNRVVSTDELRASVEAMVVRLLKVPPITLKNIKRLVSTSLETSLETQLFREIEGFAAALDTDEFKQCVRSFMAKAKQ